MNRKLRNIPIFMGAEETAAVTDAATGQANGDSGSAGDNNSGNHVVPPKVIVNTGENGATSTTVSKEEHDRVLERMKMADRNRSDAQKALDAALTKVKEFEDKDRTELEKAQRDAKEAAERATKAEEANKEIQVSNAFLSLGKVTWHNPGAALKLLDRSGISVKEDGTVEGMTDAAATLAKEHPYLVKSAAKDDGDKDDDKGKGQHKSGASTNGGNGQGRGPDREKLAKRFPQLRGR